MPNTTMHGSPRPQSMSPSHRTGIDKAIKAIPTGTQVSAARSPTDKPWRVRSAALRKQSAQQHASLPRNTRQRSCIATQLHVLHTPGLAAPAVHASNFSCPTSMHALRWSTKVTGTAFPTFPRQSFTARAKRAASTVTGPTVGSAADDVDTAEKDRDIPEVKQSDTVLLKSIAEGYNWKAQWYPVGWAVDFPKGKLHKVTLFDRDYVLLCHPDGRVECLEDRCPHRLAALSEGRLTSEGLAQCAYHGWAFDGSSGHCLDVPQVAMPRSSAQPKAQMCATALPCQEVAGLVWVLPCTDGAARRAAEQAGPTMLPAEMLDPAFRVTPIVRDFPVDYSVLVENLIDFDHGPFAHQNKQFDLYSGSASNPQRVGIQEVPADGGLQIVLRTNAVPKKILGAGRVDTKGGAKTPAEEDAPKIATSTFIAPCHVSTARRDPVTDETAFMTVFWAVPVGLGRTRFLTASVGKLPIQVPRWIGHIMLNNFVDQDTHLLATQQRYTLAAELAARSALFHGNGEVPMTRRQIFCYQSPGEPFLMALGRFLDMALPSMPNRYYAVPGAGAAAAGGAAGASDPVRAQWDALITSIPDRTVTLDRWAQHTAICPDSQAFVQRCKLIANAAALGIVAFAARAIHVVATSVVSRDWSTSTAVASLQAAAWPLIGAALCLMIFLATKKLCAEFTFKYTENLRDKDLAKVAQVYPDYKPS